MALGKPGDAISRRLFEALRLEIRYDHIAHMATCEITLTGETIGTVARASQERPPAPGELVASPPGTGRARATARRWNVQPRLSGLLRDPCRVSAVSWLRCLAADTDPLILRVRARRGPVPAWRSRHRRDGLPLST